METPLKFLLKNDYPTLIFLSTNPPKSLYVIYRQPPIRGCSIVIVIELSFIKFVQELTRNINFLVHIKRYLVFPQSDTISFLSTCMRAEVF